MVEQDIRQQVGISRYEMLERFEPWKVAPLLETAIPVDLRMGSDYMVFGYRLNSSGLRIEVTIRQNAGVESVLLFAGSTESGKLRLEGQRAAVMATLLSGHYIPQIDHVGNIVPFSRLENAMATKGRSDITIRHLVYSFYQTGAIQDNAVRDVLSKLEAWVQPMQHFEVGRKHPKSIGRAVGRLSQSLLLLDNRLMVVCMYRSRSLLPETSYVLVYVPEDGEIAYLPDLSRTALTMGAKIKRDILPLGLELMSRVLISQERKDRRILYPLLNPVETVILHTLLCEQVADHEYLLKRIIYFTEYESLNDGQVRTILARIRYKISWTGWTVSNRRGFDSYQLEEIKGMEEVREAIRNRILTVFYF